MKIIFKIDKLILEGKLNDSETAAALASRLPLSFRMARWGDEYYGGIGPDLGIAEAADARDEMEKGEIAYWPPGNALCLFFGPTPASQGDEPRAASPVNPAGIVSGGLDSLKGLGPSVAVILTAVEE